MDGLRGYRAKMPSWPHTPLLLSLLACKPTASPATTSASEATTTTTSTATTSTATTSTSGTSSTSATPPTTSAGSSATDSSTTTSTTSTTLATDFGTTVFPLPGPCFTQNHWCDSPMGGTGTGSSTGPTDPCAPVYVELEETANAQCLGDVQVTAQGPSGAECCIDFTCSLITPESKACIPLEYAEGCDDILPHVDLYSFCLQVSHNSPPFVEGDNCCVLFECYCGESG